MSHAARLNGESTEPERILVGDLSDISLPTLLHLLEIENVSGWLRLSGEAEIAFHKGHVVHAALGPHRHLAALREIFFRDDWSFEVVSGQTEQGQPMHRLPFAMMDAFHLRAEWNRIGGEIYRLVGNQRWCPTGLDVDSLMDRLDGQRTLHELIATTRVPATMAVESVLEALTLGLIEKVRYGENYEDEGTALHSEPERPTVQGAPRALKRPALESTAVPVNGNLTETADFDDLLDLARRAKRSGDLEAAEAAVRAALRVQPESRIAQQNLRRMIELRSR